MHRVCTVCRSGGWWDGGEAGVYTGMPWGLLLAAKAGREVTYDGHTSNVMFV